MKARFFSVFVSFLLLVSLVPPVASAAQNHSIPSGWNLYSITFASADSDNGLCAQGAKNWTAAAGTTMTEKSSSQNKCYYRDYPESWYGLYSKYSSYFTIKVNKRLLARDFPSQVWNASLSSTTHEFGHAQFLGDHDTAGEGVYGTTSIMSYNRNRATMTTPQSHDLSDLQQLRNSSNAPASADEAVHADFPYYHIEELLDGKTDLVVVAHVDAVSEIQENGADPLASHQEAVLRIDDTLYGQAESPTIKLYQSVDKVKAGQQYLLFLSSRPDIGQYVVSDGASQTIVNQNQHKAKSIQPASDKKLTVNINGIKGQYSNEELRQLLNEKYK